jgi:hypothetical protein
MATWTDIRSSLTAAQTMEEDPEKKLSHALAAIQGLMEMIESH